MGHNDHMGLSHFDPHVYSYHYFFSNLYKLTLLTWESKFKGKLSGGLWFHQNWIQKCDEALMKYQPWNHE